MRRCVVSRVEATCFVCCFWVDVSMTTDLVLVIERIRLTADDEAGGFREYVPSTTHLTRFCVNLGKNGMEMHELSKLLLRFSFYCVTGCLCM